MKKFVKITLALLLGVFLSATYACSDFQAIVDEAMTKIGMPAEGELSDDIAQIVPELPDEAKYAGIKIQLISSDTEVITNDGVILYSHEDKEVTVTVKLILNEKSVSKDFTYTVPAKAELVEAYMEELLNGLVYPESTSTDIDVPEFEGFEVELECDDDDVISNLGEVTQPDEDQKVTVTVTLSKGDISKSKSFDIVVLRERTDQEIVDADFDVLRLFPAAIENIDLKTSGFYGSTITWATSNEAAITAAGVVTRQENSSPRVTLTATITSGQVTKTKKFDVTVLRTTANANGGAFAVPSKWAQIFYLSFEGEEVWLTCEGMAFVDPEATERTIQFALDHTPSVPGQPAPTYATRQYNGVWYENEIEGNGMNFRFKINLSQAYKDIDTGSEWIKFFIKVTEKKGDAAETVTFLRKDSGNADGLSGAITGSGEDNWPSGNTNDMDITPRFTDKHGFTYVIRVNWNQIHLRKLVA